MKRNIDPSHAALPQGPGERGGEAKGIGFGNLLSHAGKSSIRFATREETGRRVISREGG